MNKRPQEKIGEVETLSSFIESELAVELMESLSTLGLSKYESQVLAVMYVFKESEVKNIAVIAQVPMGRIYDALSSLVENSLIQRIKIKGKPLRYRVNNHVNALGKIYDGIKRDIDLAINLAVKSVSQLQKIKINNQQTTQEPVEVIFGTWNISNVLKETILSTESDIIILLSADYLKSQKTAIKSLSDKNVDILAFCISEEEKEELHNLEIPYYYLNLDVHIPALRSFFLDQINRIQGVVVDNQMVFLTLLQEENEPYGILTTHPSLVQTVAMLIQSLIPQLDSSS